MTPHLKPLYSKETVDRLLAAQIKALLVQPPKERSPGAYSIVNTKEESSERISK